MAFLFDNLNFLANAFSGNELLTSKKNYTTTNNTSNQTTTNVTDSRSFLFNISSPNSSLSNNPSVSTSQTPSMTFIPSVSTGLNGSTPTSPSSSSSSSSNLSNILFYGALGLGGYLIFKSIGSKK